MSEPMKLQTYDPKQRAERNQHERDGDVEFILTCWACHKDFSVWIGLGNMNQSIFKCVHCDERVEIE